MCTHVYVHVCIYIYICIYTHTILYYTILYHIILYYIISYYIMLCYIILYYIILYYIITPPRQSVQFSLQCRWLCHNRTVFFLGVLCVCSFKQEVQLVVWMYFLILKGWIHYCLTYSLMYLDMWFEAFNVKFNELQLWVLTVILSQLISLIQHFLETSTGHGNSTPEIQHFLLKLVWRNLWDRATPRTLILVSIYFLIIKCWIHYGVTHNSMYLDMWFEPFNVKFSELTISRIDGVTQRAGQRRSSLGHPARRASEMRPLPRPAFARKRGDSVTGNAKRGLRKGIQKGIDNCKHLFLACARKYIIFEGSANVHTLSLSAGQWASGHTWADYNYASPADAVYDCHVMHARMGGFNRWGSKWGFSKGDPKGGLNIQRLIFSISV